MAHKDHATTDIRQLTGSSLTGQRALHRLDGAVLRTYIDRLAGQALMTWLMNKQGGITATSTPLGNAS